MNVRTIDLDGPVHYADFGGSGPATVLVHGLGGSHLNWMAVGPKLAQRARVVALDLPGFGPSPPSRAGSSLRAIRKTLERFIDEIAGGPATVIGNSMGGALSILTAAESPERVERLVLVDPALPVIARHVAGQVDATTFATFVTYFVPGVGELYVRKASEHFGPERIVRYMLRRCCADATRVPEEIVAEHISLVARRAKEMPWGHTTFIRAARSLLMHVALHPSLLHEAIAKVRAPALVIHGDRDLLVPVAAVRALAKSRPDFSLVVMEDSGHVPMLEHPARFVDAVWSWLDCGELRESA